MRAFSFVVGPNAAIDRAAAVLLFWADGTALLGTVRARRATARMDAHRWTRRSGARVALRPGGGGRGGAEPAAANRRPGRFQENCPPSAAKSWPNAFASTRWRGPWRKSTPAVSTPGIFIRPAGRPWSPRFRNLDPFPDYLLLDAIELDLPDRAKGVDPWRRALDFHRRGVDPGESGSRPAHGGIRRAVSAVRTGAK